MANVQKLKVNIDKDAIIEASGALKSTGAVFDLSSVTSGTNLFALPATANAGVTIASTMTISPETTAESGFITITVDGTAYQIPIYAA